MIKGFLNLPWFVWAALAFVVALVYTFVWPHRNVTSTTDFRYFIIRWGHALVWALLAINFVLRGISPSWNGVANVFALAGAVVYFLFITMTFIRR